MKDLGASEPELDKLSPYGRFLHHCERGELAYQRSGSGRAVFYPRIADPEDGGLQWEISGGLGRVHSVTLVHHRDEAPFALVLVDLDEGFRMMSRIDTDAPEAVAIGTRVRVGFRRLADGRPVLPIFTVTDDAE